MLVRECVFPSGVFGRGSRAVVLLASLAGALSLSMSATAQAPSPQATAPQQTTPAAPQPTPSSPQPASQPASATSLPDFFDEPKFTVAGVTPGASYGGHGSDTAIRASEALVRATGTLGKDSSGQETTPPSDLETLKRQHDDIQSQIRHEEPTATKPQQAERHHQLAEVCEKLGDPLAAVLEYQRAAELAPTEAHLFDWASELLTHRASEAATEIFDRGTRLYPQSVRMVTGLGIAWYARHNYDRASEFLVAASDLAPADITPYLFMGKMESVEPAPTHDSLARLERFQRLMPENALANYYYALGLWKEQQTAGSLDPARLDTIETLLNKSVRLDPKLGPAFLQLGALHASQHDDARALTEYQKAVEVNPDLEEAHYRFALAYRRAGKTAEAQKEMQIYNQLSKKSREETDHQRHEMQQFVVTMRH